MAEQNTDPVSARDLWRSVGYVDWRNFEGLISRTDQLIRCGLSSGRISKTKKSVRIGSGASRLVIDYELDLAARDAVLALASSYKLHSHHQNRSETAILSLLQKWAEFRGWQFEFQKVSGEYRFDLLIGERIVVEFDEPHHGTKRQQEADLERDNVVTSRNLQIVRFDLNHDIVDMICQLEQMMVAQQ